LEKKTPSVAAEKKNKSQQAPDPLSRARSESQPPALRSMTAATGAAPKRPSSVTNALIGSKKQKKPKKEN